MGSITITADGGSGATLDITLRATNCSGNGLGSIEDVNMSGNSTTQLTYPVPEIFPGSPIAVGSHYCVFADVVNGDQLAGGLFTIRVVGYGVS
jgi:hypothetical protein